jgi:hypothetical protein
MRVRVMYFSTAEGFAEIPSKRFRCRGSLMEGKSGFAWESRGYKIGQTWFAARVHGWARTAITC